MGDIKLKNLDPKSKDKESILKEEEEEIKMKNSVLRASVQTLTVIDGAITTLLMIAVLLIGVLVPYFEPKPPYPMELPKGTHLTPDLAFPNIPAEYLAGNYHRAAPMPNPFPTRPTTTYPTEVMLYNSSDAYWWYYSDFEDYLKTLRKMGNILDTTFVFILFVIVASDIALAKGVDLMSDPKYAPRYIYYWLVCNITVIIILPMLSALSTKIASFTGVLHECGLGCGKPYFYITYRILYGLMVVLFLCQFNQEMKLEQQRKLKEEKNLTV